MKRGLNRLSDPTKSLGGQTGMNEGPVGKALHRGERNALRCFSAFETFEAASRHPRISVPSLRSLVVLGLAVEGEPGILGPVFKLTEEGRRAARALVVTYRSR